MAKLEVKYENKPKPICGNKSRPGHVTALICLAIFEQELIILGAKYSDQKT